jgi:hypothetical protein
MPHDVFISYSQKDKPIADAICANLEIAGFRCWIAPRDIAPGMDWPTAISAAIALSRVMVLVFSADSNRSKQVGNEISLAFDNDLIIIPFKIDNTAPEPGKQYYLARTHWLDAMNPPTQEQINTLVGYVRSFLAGQKTTETAQPAPEVKPPPPQTVKVEPASLQKGAGRKSLWIWGVLLLAAIITGSIFIMRSLGSDPLPTSTSVPSFTSTSTLTSTPTLSRTSTPRPTATKTPQPAWVTDFARPILDTIASRSPSFQDDFGLGSAGWQADDYCGRRMQYVKGELVVTDCRLSNPNINYVDFVAEFDARFFAGAGRDSEWAFHFRDIGPSYEIRINYLGDVRLFFYEGNDYDFPGVANPGEQSNHVMVIAKGSRIAFYINSEPLTAVDISSLRYGDLRFFADGTILAIDNFKIWNINSLP